MNVLRASMSALLLVSACGEGAPATSVDAGAVATDAGAGSSCPLGAFSACGGNLEGTWRLVDFCDLQGQAASRPRPCAGPGGNMPACQGGTNSSTCRALYRVTAEIGPDTMVLTTAIFAALRFTVTDACLAGMAGGATAADACLALARPASGLSCAYQPDQCTCEGTTAEPLQTGVDRYPYTRDGNRITLRPGPGMATGAYCVSGNRLGIQFDAVGSQGWRSWVLER
jgi:hypothetical protein